MSRTRRFLVRYNQSAVISRSDRLIVQMFEVSEIIDPYHALQSLGQLIGLQHVFALLMLGAVHHLGPVVHCLFCERGHRAVSEEGSEMRNPQRAGVKAQHTHRSRS